MASGSGPLCLRRGHDGGRYVGCVQTRGVNARQPVLHNTEHGVVVMTYTDERFLEIPQRFGRLHEEVTRQHKPVDQPVTHRDCGPDQATRGSCAPPR